MVRRADGRIVERFLLDADLAAEAERRAEAAGVDLATYLGDEIARVLPDALADTARRRLDLGRDSLRRYSALQVAQVERALADTAPASTESQVTQALTEVDR